MRRTLFYAMLMVSVMVGFWWYSGESQTVLAQTADSHQVYMPVVLRHGRPPTKTPTPTPSPTPSPTPTPTPTPPPGASTYPTVMGIMGMPLDAFSTVLALNGRTVEYRGSTNPSQVQAAFDAAKSQGLNFLLRGPDRLAFTTADGHLDMAAVTNILHTTFDGTTLIGDPAFVGFYLIDEPCHPDKFNITGAEMAELYATIKAYDPSLKLFVNFGKLSGCLDTLLAESGGAPITDFAAFTVTVPKMNYAAYLDAQVQTTLNAKATTPGLQVIPMLAVWEGANMPMPDEQWIRDTGSAVWNTGAFDGVLFYPWTTPSWATRSLDDVIDTYADDVAFVFSMVAQTGQ